MKTIAHISDLHFGRLDRQVAEGLVADLHALTPALLVVSGDLTQRARRRQFDEARAYLQRLPQPQIVVPGNHDIPLYDVTRRFLWPLTRYRQYITAELRPIFRDDDMVVLGVNTARPFVPDWRAFWKGGRISEEQLIDLRLKLRDADPGLFKVVVTHHPFLPAPGEKRSDVVGRPRESLDAFEQCGVDMLLAGHLHLNYSGDLRSHHTAVTRSILSIHAGTATSTRGRGGEPNSYNRITIDGDRVSVEVRAWNGGRFDAGAVADYRRVDHAWQPIQ